MAELIARASAEAAAAGNAAQAAETERTLAELLRGPMPPMDQVLARARGMAAQDGGAAGLDALMRGAEGSSRGEPVAAAAAETEAEAAAETEAAIETAAETEAEAATRTDIAAAPEPEPEAEIAAEFEMGSDTQGGPAPEIGALDPPPVEAPAPQMLSLDQIAGESTPQEADAEETFAGNTTQASDAPIATTGEETMPAWDGGDDSVDEVIEFSFEESREFDPFQELTMDGGADDPVLDISESPDDDPFVEQPTNMRVARTEKAGDDAASDFGESLSVNLAADALDPDGLMASGVDELTAEHTAEHLAGDRLQELDADDALLVDAPLMELDHELEGEIELVEDDEAPAAAQGRSSRPPPMPKPPPIPPRRAAHGSPATPRPGPRGTGGAPQPGSPAPAESRSGPYPAPTTPHGNAPQGNMGMPPGAIPPGAPPAGPHPGSYPGTPPPVQYPVAESYGDAAQGDDDEPQKRGFFSRIFNKES